MKQILRGGAALALLSLALPSGGQAATYNEGDACTAAGAVHRKNDATGEFVLICNGSVWVLVTKKEFDGTAGVIETDKINLQGIGSIPDPLSMLVEELNDLSDVSAASPNSDDVLTWNGSSWVAQAAGSASAAGADREIQFNSGGALGADANFVFTSAGRLGIGTATPQFLLDVGSSSTMHMTLNNSVETNDDPYNLGMPTDPNSTRRFTLSTEQGSIQAAMQFGDSGNYFGLARSLDSGVTWLPNLVLSNNSGELMIGTNTPNDDGSTAIKIVGADQDIKMYSYNDGTGAGSRANVLFIRGRGTEETPSIVQENDHLGGLSFGGYDGSISVGSASIIVQVDGPTGSGDMPGRIVFSTTPDGSNSELPRMTIKNDGKIGIGTESPSEALDVAGNINYTGVITDISDRRMKTDIADLPPGQLEKILALKGVSFRMKDDPDGETEFGLIAQDVQDVYPEVVRSLSNGTLSLNYMGLIAPTIVALQEQQKATVALQAEIEVLRAELKALKAERGRNFNDRYND